MIAKKRQQDKSLVGIKSMLADVLNLDAKSREKMVQRHILQ